MRTLLTRDDFREAVFKRDGYHCLFCEETQGLDAHHIIERRLFSDGGYYIDNGVTLCQKHHLLAESTELSCDAIRTMAGIIDIVLPEDFYDDCSYDKWGNIHIGKLRTKGPLFFDEETIKSIQIDTGTKEGYVVRVCDSFAYGEFSKSIAKFVRKNHVQDTVHNWRRGKIDKNELEIKV